MLAVRAKRFDRQLVTYLTEPETEALPAACDRFTWTGQRDHTMSLLAVQTGLRVSELITLTCADIDLGRAAQVHCVGKGPRSAGPHCSRARWRC